MRKKIAIAMLAVMGVSGGAALADRPTSDNLAEHPALYGLCTAWFANENGRENGNAENAPPFQALQDAADEAGDGDGTATDEEMQDFCEGVRPSNGRGNGSGNSNAPDPTSR